MRKRMASGFTLLGLWMTVCQGSSAWASQAGKEPKAPRLQVGDSTVNGGIYKPFTSRWVEFEVRPDGTREEKSISCERMTLQKSGSRRVLEDVQRTLTGENQGDHLSFQLDRQTLAPLFVETYDASSGTSARFEFAPSEVRVRCAADGCPPALRSPAGEEIRRTIALETPVFEFFQASWGTLLAALPLRSGYRATLPVLKPGAGCYAVRLAAPGTKWMTFEVGEPEEVAFEGHAARAWPVTSPQAKFVIHVMQEPPYWIRYESPGPGGTMQIYERVSAAPDSCSMIHWGRASQAYANKMRSAGARRREIL
jgi:hypothetical protein